MERSRNKQNNQMNATTIKIGIWSAIIVGTIAAIMTLVFGLYLFYAFVLWIFSDPLDLVEDFFLTRENKDVATCRQAGGLPKKSAWDGRLLECLPKPSIK